MYKLFRILGDGEVGVPFRADTAEEIAKHIEETELKHFYVCRLENVYHSYIVIMRVDGGEFFIRSNRMPAALKRVYDRLQEAHKREALERSNE
jgi:hypothetical protein